LSIASPQLGVDLAVFRSMRIDRQRMALTLVAAAAAVGFFAAAAIASAQSRRDRALVLHPMFERVRGSYLVGGGRYVFIASHPSGGGGVLIDGSSGRRVTVSPSPGCKAFAIGAPWLAFGCGPGFLDTELYNIPAGRFQSLTSRAPYEYCTSDCLSVAAIGSHWAAFSAPAGDPRDYPSFEFQNLQTGQVVDNDPANATHGLDLNSPQLVQSICRPLSLPRVSNGYTSGWGSLTFDDGFAIASGGGGAYLERCGSPLHEFLTFTTPSNVNGIAWCPYLDCSPASNAHEIIWPSEAGRLRGIFLPDRRRFTIQLPVKVETGIGEVPGSAHGYTLALTPTRLYLLNPQGQIWSITAPTEHSKPTGN
jgi:hypothetical protein